MKYSKLTLPIGALSIFMTCANSYAAQPNLNFVEVGYGQTKVEDLIEDDSFKGFNLAASFEVSDSWYVPMSYYKHSGSSTERFSNEFNSGSIVEMFDSKTNIDFSELTVGLGYQFSLGDTSIVSVDVSYLKIKAEVNAKFNYIVLENGVPIDGATGDEDFSESDNGVLTRVMYRNLINDNLQLNLGLRHKAARINSETTTETSGIIEGIYHIDERFSIKLAGIVADEQSIVASARYSF